MRPEMMRLVKPVKPLEIRVKDAKRGFATIQHIHTAAEFWYGKHDRDHTCLAENRLIRGDIPEIFLTVD